MRCCSDSANKNNGWKSDGLDVNDKDQLETRGDGLILTDPSQLVIVLEKTISNRLLVIPGFDKQHSRLSGVDVSTPFTDTPPYRALYAYPGLA